MRIPFRAVVAVLLVAVSSSSSAGREKVPSKTVSKEDLSWAVQMGYVGSLTVADGKVFVGANNSGGTIGRRFQERGDVILPVFAEDDDRENPYAGGSAVTCLDLETGAFLWRSPHRAIKRPAGIEYYPVSSTVSVAGDRAYYLSTDWVFVCVDTMGFRDRENDGPYDRETDTSDLAADIVWKIDLRRDLGVAPQAAGDIGYVQSSPLVVGDTVFIVTGNGFDWTQKRVPAPDAPSFLAVDRKSGKVKWQSSAPGHGIHWMQVGTPASRGMDVIFPGGDGRLYKFGAADGMLVGSVDLNAVGKTEGLFVSSRFAMADGLLFTALGLCMESGGQPGSPLMAIDLGNLSPDGVRWMHRHQSGNGMFGVPLVAGDTLFANFFPNHLVAFDHASGEVKWEVGVEAPNGFGRDYLPAYAAPLVVGDRLYCGTDGGDFFELSISQKGKILGVMELNDACSEHATPVHVPGGIVMATRNSVLRLKLPFAFE